MQQNSQNCGHDHCDNDNPSFGKYFADIHRYSGMYLHEKMAPFGLGRGQIFFIIQLFHEDGIHQEVLTRRTQLDKATCTRAMRKLEEEGFVIRKEDPSDRRAYRVFLTEKSRDLEDDIRSVFRGLSDILTEGIDEEELAEVREVLKKVRGNIHDWVEDNRGENNG